MKNIELPKEGDLLFEEKSLLNRISWWWIMFILAPISTSFSLIELLKFSNLDNAINFTILLLIGGIGLFYIIIVAWNGFKNGFNDETYKGYYFSDKIVIYRISKQVDELYTNGLTKDEILEQIQLLEDHAKTVEETFGHAFVIGDFMKFNREEQINFIMQRSDSEVTIEMAKDFCDTLFNRKILLELYKKGVVIAEEGLGKPHKTVINFADVKYFLNEKVGIKMVQKDQENENNLNRFYNSLILSKKYKKYPAEVVEFLNQNLQK